MQNQHATRFERCGAHVVVTENGWVGKAPGGGKLYALCRNHHNGRGQWREGEPGRWKQFGVELKAWRPRGDHIVVLPQRGIGEPGVAMPRDWVTDVMRRLLAVTKRPIRIRKHPGEKKGDDLYEDLRGAHAVVTWGSGAAIKAIAAGIPAFYELNNWVGAPAARMGLGSIEEPFMGDREPMFDRLAWAQWSVPEIESGEPFKWLLS